MNCTTLNFIKYYLRQFCGWERASCWILAGTVSPGGRLRHLEVTTGVTSPGMAGTMIAAPGGN